MLLGLLVRIDICSNHRAAWDQHGQYRYCAHMVQSMDGGLVEVAPQNQHSGVRAYSWRRQRCTM